MNNGTFKSLEFGDQITHFDLDGVWIVTGNYGSHVTAVQTMNATNPAEWQMVLKAKYEKPNQARFAQEG